MKRKIYPLFFNYFIIRKTKLFENIFFFYCFFFFFFLKAEIIIESLMKGDFQSLK